MKPQKNSNTAILLFSRTAKEEIKFKNWSASKSAPHNLSVAKALIAKAKQAAKDSDLSLVISNERDQEGNNFGERFCNAVEGVFQAGFEKVIVIGNDCVSMNSQLINHAAELLKERSSVIGPASDGGVYLVGLTANDYQRENMLHLPWESAQLAETCADELDCSLNLLPSALDLDNANDVEQFFKDSSLSGSKLFNQLKSILQAAAKQAICIGCFVPMQGARNCEINKGPPKAA